MLLLDENRPTKWSIRKEYASEDQVATAAMQQNYCISFDKSNLSYGFSPKAA